MIRRKPTRWRIDWRGDGAPAPGQLVRHVTVTGRVSYARVQTVRVVRPRKPMRPGVTCCYALGVQRLDAMPAGEPAAWTCHAYAPPKRRPRAADSEGGADIDVDPWSPLL